MWQTSIYQLLYKQANVFIVGERTNVALYPGDLVPEVWGSNLVVDRRFWDLCVSTSVETYLKTNVACRNVLFYVYLASGFLIIV